MDDLNDRTRESLEGLLVYWKDVAPASEWKQGAVEEIEQALAAPAPLTDEQWDEYFTRLAGPEGCDFEGQFRCASGFDKTYSTLILQNMGLGLDDEQIEAVHRIVNALGGHCDCEIVMNAAPRILASWDQEMPEVPS